MAATAITHLSSRSSDGSRAFHFGKGWKARTAGFTTRWPALENAPFRRYCMGMRTTILALLVAAALVLIPEQSNAGPFGVSVSVGGGCGHGYYNGGYYYPNASFYVRPAPVYYYSDYAAP